MASWQPNPESLNQLCGFLRDSLMFQDKSAQKNAEMVRRSLCACKRGSFMLELPRLEPPNRGQHPEC